MQASQDKRKQELTKALGRVMSKLRAESKRSVRSTALEVGLSKTTLLLAEAGKLDPQLSTICRFAEAFYISPDKLFQLIYEELPEGWTILDES